MKRARRNEVQNEVTPITSLHSFQLPQASHLTQHLSRDGGGVGSVLEAGEEEGVARLELGIFRCKINHVKLFGVIIVVYYCPIVSW